MITIEELNAIRDKTRKELEIRIGGNKEENKEKKDK